MDTSSKLLSLFIYVFGCLAKSDSFFDIEELKSVNYGIDILSEPVVMKPKDELPANAVFITSKYGQEYQCSFPSNVDEEKEKEAAEKVAMETGIPDLLKPMEDEPCLHKTKDWWSYEFCYSKHIRQFHLSDEGQIEGEILVLGMYESEFDWNTADKPGKDKSGNQVRKYHTQQYVNGTKCDLNKKHRRTEVRFVCEEGSGDYIARLDEPEACGYIMTVHTTKICHHPYLKPPQPRQTVPITCSPLLNTVQYHQYLDDVAVTKEKEREMERLQKERLEEQERLQGQRDKYLRDRQLHTDEDGAVEGEASDAAGEESALGDDGQDWLDVMKTAGGEAGAMKTIYKVIESPDDVKQFLEEAMTEMKRIAEVKVQENGGKLEHDGDTGSEGDQGSEDKETEVREGLDDEEVEDDEDDDETEINLDEDEEMLKDFNRELRTIKQRYQDKKERLSEIKEKVRRSMEKQYDAVLKEAQEELAAEEAGVEVDIDKKKAFGELTETLTQLLAKLDTTEKEISAVDKELDNFVSYDHEGTTEKQKTSLHPAKSQGVKTAGTRDATQTKATSGLSKSPSSTTADDRVKVRISRMNRGLSTKDAAGGATDKQLAELEKGVEQQLQAAGVDGGNKIQVKIITAGFYDDDDDTLRVLSEEESESFKNMIVSLMGGTSAANKEELRQSQLEDNYSKVWGRDGPSATIQASGPGDTQTDAHTDTNTHTDTSVVIDSDPDTNTQMGTNSVTESNTVTMVTDSDDQSDIEDSEDS